MAQSKEYHKCAECGKKMQRCRAASVIQVDDRPEIQWVCRRCWEALNYDNYMYDKQYGHGV